VTPTVLAPRPLPAQLPPVAAGTAVVLLALPVFLVAHWPLGAWTLAAVLWFAGQALGYVLRRLRFGPDNLAASSVLAFGMMFRAIAVLVVVLAVAVSNAHLALGAAVVYALAYTLELGTAVVMYFAGAAR
jgi:hypothetical protein